MAQPTQNYKRSIAGSIGAGMKSVLGGSGRRYYVLEHKVSSKYHKAGESQRIIVDEIELGRDTRCQVRFDESFTTVSRRHAAIVKEGDGWKLVQLSKTNSTYLNGHKVTTQWYLQNGDEIQLSTNGPKMGFIIPAGDSGLVKSIGMTARLNLFRQQALRPYKQALSALAAVLILCVAVGTYVVHLQHQEIKYQGEKIVEQSNTIAGLNTQITEDRAEMARMEKDREEKDKQRDEEARKQQEKIETLIDANKKLKDQLGHLDKKYKEMIKKGGGDLSRMLQEKGIYDDVFFLVAHKVVYIINGEEHLITTKDSEGNERNYGWSGTGFLLNDGRFVTARHCIQGWFYGPEYNSNEMISQAVRAKESGMGVSIKGYYTAYSTRSGRKLNFTSDDFKVDESEDKIVEIGTDEQGNTLRWRFTFPASADWSERMWSTDWAYTTKTGGARGSLVADAQLAQSLLPMQKLIVLGFPKGLGVESGTVEPISYELTTTREGLAENGCIMHSAGTDHGNSGGPIFAISGDDLVVVGIVSRGDGKSEYYNWAVPIGNAR